jgi:hypothetical protein
VYGDDPTGDLAGASLFVFSVDPKWGNMYFWLGKERRNLQWPQGSETWSDFGGRAQHPGEDPPQVAAREFVEETCGMLSYFEHDTIPRHVTEDIAASLRNGEYLFRVVMWTEVAERKRLFVTYVKQIPWSPHAMHEFHETHQYLAKLRSRLMYNPHLNLNEVRSVFLHPAIVQSSAGAHVSSDYLEKISIRMWSIAQLREAINLQLMRESRAKAAGVPLVAVPYNECQPPSLAYRMERFRSCFISMVMIVLKELPLYDT